MTRGSNSNRSWWLRSANCLGLPKPGPHHTTPSQTGLLSGLTTPCFLCWRQQQPSIHFTGRTTLGPYEWHIIAVLILKLAIPPFSLCLVDIFWSYVCTGIIGNGPYTNHRICPQSPENLQEADDRVCTHMGQKLDRQKAHCMMRRYISSLSKRTILCGCTPQWPALKELGENYFDLGMGPIALLKSYQAPFIVFRTSAPQDVDW